MPSQWETKLHCNVVSHRVSSYTKWSLEKYHMTGRPLQLDIVVSVSPHWIFGMTVTMSKTYLWHPIHLVPVQNICTQLCMSMDYSLRDDSRLAPSQWETPLRLSLAGRKPRISPAVSVPDYTVPIPPSPSVAHSGGLLNAFCTNDYLQTSNISRTLIGN